MNTPHDTRALAALIEAMIAAPHLDPTPFGQHVRRRLEVFTCGDDFAEHCAHLRRTGPRSYRFAYRSDVLDTAYPTRTGQLVYQPEPDPWQIMHVTLDGGTDHPKRVRISQPTYHGSDQSPRFGTADGALEAMRYLRTP